MKKQYYRKKRQQQLTSKEVGLKYGFRSGLEEAIADELEKAQITFEYEETKLKYIKPQKAHTYTPDFYLPKQKIFIETKGMFTTADRQKMKLVKAQHPDLDIRFILVTLAVVSVSSPRLLMVCGVRSTDLYMQTRQYQRSG